MNKRVMSVVVAVLLSSSLFGACEYAQNGDIVVGFQAYKTPLKIGVGGEFNDVQYMNNIKTAKDLSALLKGSTVNINTTSVDSANPARDKKLVDFFFNTMSQKGIFAKITDLKLEKSEIDGKMTGVVFVDIKMNNVSHPAEMKFTYEKGVFQADGFIDLKDYNALVSLASINKACYDLHKGKTWSDVAISFNMNIKADCQ
ncbi:MAG: YceI family protein [Thiovulaceae bacterium]|nr:YceI family protein [Sulfurimonadaceae bacterium]